MSKWISAKDKLPEGEDFVLVIASGNPRSNITLQNAYELATYSKETGWIFEVWPEWEDAKITHWMSLPEPPGEEQEKHARWIEEFFDEEDGHTYCTCSNCLKVRAPDNYCPNCGAKMDMKP